MSEDKPVYDAGQITGLRDRLDEIDAEILRLVAERQETVTRIGEQKHRDGRPLRDYAREAQVINRGRRRAESLGMGGEIAQDILERLIHHSLSNQEQRQLARSGHGAGRRALVIGGLGRMGDWVARYLDTVGFEVQVADPAPGDSLFPRVTHWPDAGVDHEVIVVAAPLNISNEILLQLAELKPEGLIFDVGSLKLPLRPGLEALCAAGCKVASVHPMFGPDAMMLSGRHILLVGAGHDQALQEVASLFSHTAADCVEVDLETHDEVMSWVLGLSHILNISFAGALSQSADTLPLLKRISSSTFNAQLEIATQVVSENPLLYFEIQQGTRRYPQALQRFTSVLSALMQGIETGNQQAFVDLMTQANEQLAGRKGHAL